MLTDKHCQEAKRILVFRIGELGDTLIALPSLRAIRAAFPGSHLALLGNVDSLSRHVPPNQTLPVGLIDEWFSYPSGESTLGFSGSIRLLSRLRRSRFDLLVYLAPSLRRPVDVRRDLLFFRLCGITAVIGDKGFVSRARRAGEPLPFIPHEADYLLHRLAQSDISVPAPGAAVFDLELTDGERSTADDWLGQQIPASGARRMVGFGPGSKAPSKVWPEERFAELGFRLTRENKIYPIVFGGPEDRELAERLIGAWGKGANAAGELLPRQAAAALSRCVMYVGNDTGTMHLAAAVGTPCVVAMCAQDWPGHWNPYGEGHVVLRRSVPCEGCFLKVCITEGMRCLKEIEVDEVLSACNRVLSRGGDKERALDEMSGVLAV
jgi:lipopolysaccharide heptosyltransferase III